MATTAGESLEALRGGFSGTVLDPAHADYDDARQIHNGLIDRRPALIARCRNTADVSDAVKHARAERLEVCVRGGGHNVAGRAVIDDALMIDLSPMKGIHVDPAAKTVRAQGGTLWNEFNRETAHHGLATTGGAISTTGVAGLTLGGGLGWLMAKHGLAADNLIGVELVTADGTVQNVTEESDPDLMWALRGGGGNFGIAASLQFELHSLTMVTGGLIAHPLEAAGEMLRFYRDAVASASDDLTVFAALVHAPDGSGHKIAGDGGLPHRHARGGRGRARALQGVRLSARRRGRTDALPGHEHDPRRRIPEGPSQLLALELHDRAHRQPDRHRYRAIREHPVTQHHPLRALPRRGLPDPGGEHRGSAPPGGLEPPAADGLARPGRQRGEHHLDEGHTRRLQREPHRTPLAQLPRATTRERMRSAAPTARTTTGSSS